MFPLGLLPTSMVYCWALALSAMKHTWVNSLGTSSLTRTAVVVNDTRMTARVENKYSKLSKPLVFSDAINFEIHNYVLSDKLPICGKCV